MDPEFSDAESENPDEIQRPKDGLDCSGTHAPFAVHPEVTLDEITSSGQGASSPAHPTSITPPNASVYFKDLGATPRAAPQGP